MRDGLGRSFDAKFGVTLTKGIIVRIDIRNVITSNSVWRTRDTYEIRARIARICIGSRRYFIAVRARYLVMRNVSSWVPGSVSPLPLERGNLPISTTASAFSALRRAATISSSSVRRRNNLIPYSRGGCRPWRIEWNKIKPRIPRVLWRGSVPYPSRKSRISTSAACARVYIHTVSFCSSFCFTFHSLILSFLSSVPCISVRPTVFSSWLPFCRW